MKRSVAVLALLAALSPASMVLAKGTVVVQQADGSKQSYPNSTLRIVGKTLRLTSADRKGTLIITDAACSYVGKLLQCLPYAATLQQNGTHTIALQRGMIYINPTGETQRLKYSSTQIPPHGVLAIVRSVAGTYVSVSGTLDGRT